VRHLAGEIGAEFNERLSKQEAAEAAKAAAAKAEAADGDVAIVEAEAGEPKDPAELMPLILAQITPFFMKHNAEAEAIDLLMEVSRLDELVAHVDKTNCDRICAYLSQLSMVHTAAPRGFATHRRIPRPLRRVPSAACPLPDVLCRDTLCRVPLPWATRPLTPPRCPRTATTDVASPAPARALPSLLPRSPPLVPCAQYVPEPEDSMVLTVAVNSLRKLDRFPEALMMAVRLQDDALLEEILTSCEDP
jgi:hypothetical protein